MLYSMYQNFLSFWSWIILHYRYIPHCLFIPLLIVIWIASTFCLLLIMLLWIWVYRHLFETLLSVLWGCRPRSEIAWLYVISAFNFLRNYQLFPTKAAPFCISANNAWDFSNCSTSLSNLLFSVFGYILFWIRAFLCVCVQSLSCVWLFATPWTIAHQAPLSMGFFWQEYWSRLPFPPPGDLLNPETESASLALQVDSLPLSRLESPGAFLMGVKWYLFNYCLLKRRIKLSISFFAFWYLKNIL